MKFLYDLFHNNEKEIRKFYSENNVKYNEEIFKPMRKYETLDQQTKKISKREGIEQGIEQGRREKAQEDYERMLNYGIPDEKAKEIAFKD